jgi:(1->4)-alpha-D-glucan 1-alpha-D-glucosylmutase
MISEPLFAQLLDRTRDALKAKQFRPESTYRLQLHKGFRFADAEAIVPYLADLGVTACYASPYLKARPGSMHGYDISDHRRLNPEIGSDDEYASWVGALRQRGLGQILDIVPNHMGIMGNENEWWNDVLENGRASAHAAFFDIDWHCSKPDLHDKVLLPILGDPYGKALETMQLQLHYDAGAFAIHYFDHHIPIAPCTYGMVLGHRVEELEGELGKESEAFVEFESIRTAIAHLPPHSTTDPDKSVEHNREKEVIKRRLVTLTASAPAVRAFVEHSVQRFNGAESNGDLHRFDLLDNLLNAQPYRLAYWRVASDEINYRRFFDINELAAISMEKPEVFKATHELVLGLLRRSQVQGLRIDHPDGLYDPRQYLERLQHNYALEVARNIAQTDPAFAGLDWGEYETPLLNALRTVVADPEPANPFRRPLYIVVEKILGPDEPLPEDWPVEGTTGYEFLNALTGLLVDRQQTVAFTRLYRKWTRDETSFRDLVYQKKFVVLQVSLASELNMLAVQLDRLSEKNRWSRDFTLNSLRRALREIIACFEVYRSYITGPDIRPRDRRYVENAVRQAKRRNPAISGALFDFVRDMLLLEHPEHPGAPREAATVAEQRRFVGKFQQVTAPVMAKGLEDTAFYVYNRLLALNEVGGDPRQFGSTVAAFHRRNQERLARFPHALSATATHDTKRGEDTRARIAVLSEMPREWQQAVSRWSRLNKKFKVQREDETWPDRNEEYFLYQTLIGAWPLSSEGMRDEGRGMRAEPDPSALIPHPSSLIPSDFCQRIQAYMEKAMHEAKVHTSWINPNPAFDEAMRQFVAAILDEERGRRFLADFRVFQRRVDHYGLFNGLSQLLWKLASPGVPDVYQGTELWDFSLVDPDNRRPVDYARRRRLLAELARRASEGDSLARRASEGREEPSLARRANGRVGLTELCRELTEQRADGRIKMYLLTRALHCRRQQPGLFTEGEYLPAQATPDRDENVCAFVRRRDGQLALAAAPRLLTRLAAPGALPLGPDAWGDSFLFLPAGGAGRLWQNVFTGEVITARERDGQPGLELAQLFALFPAALLLANEE